MRYQKSAIFIFLLLILFNQTFAQKTTVREILWTTDWSPDGKFIAIGGNVDTLKIYSEKQSKTIQIISCKKHDNTCKMASIKKYNCSSNTIIGRQIGYY